MKAASGKCVAPSDGVAAYQIAIECLPRPDMWERAVRARTARYSIDADRVFLCVSGLRKELQARIGDLLYGPADLSCVKRDAPPLDDQAARAAKLAYELVLEHFPDDALLAMALPCRRDGSEPSGVVDVLNSWRREIHIRLGDVAAMVADSRGAGLDPGLGIAMAG